MVCFFEVALERYPEIELESLSVDLFAGNLIVVFFLIDPNGNSHRFSWTISEHELLMNNRAVTDILSEDTPSNFDVSPF